MASPIVRTQLGVVVLGIAAATLFGGALPHESTAHPPAPQQQEQGQQPSDAAPAADATR